MDTLRATLEASRAAEIKAIIASQNALDDEALVHDMIEGETSFYEVLESLVSALAEEESMVAGIKERMGALQERKRRYENRAQAIRGIIQRCMSIAGERKAVLPEATISIGAARQKVIITDEAAIPDNFLKIEKSPLLKDIGDALKAGECFPWATMSNGGETLTIRTK